MRTQAYIIVLPTNEAGEYTAPVRIDFEYEEAVYTFHKDLYLYVDNPNNVDEDLIVSVELHQCLAEVVLMLVERFKDTLKFWAQENPKGRLEKLLPHFKQYRQMTFQPNEYGDPYTKLTVLWGEFNKDLPKNPVPATEGSKMHTKVRSQAARSETPLGFAKAFFIANP